MSDYRLSLARMLCINMLVHTAKLVTTTNKKKDVMKSLTEQQKPLTFISIYSFIYVSLFLCEKLLQYKKEERINIQRMASDSNLKRRDTYGMPQNKIVQPIIRNAPFK
jgi:hypothetical protein